MERNALFLSDNVISFPPQRMLPVAKMSNERLEALGELYTRLKIGERYRLDFDSYVWAVHTGRWYEFVEKNFKRVHCAVFTEKTAENEDYSLFVIIFVVAVLMVLGGMK